MKLEPRLSGGDAAERTPLARRLLFLLLYWAGGVAAVGLVAFLIRSWLL
jgi:hypothetical protein